MQLYNNNNNIIIVRLLTTWFALCCIYRIIYTTMSNLSRHSLHRSQPARIKYLICTSSPWFCRRACELRSRRLLPGHNGSVLHTQLFLDLTKSVVLNSHYICHLNPHCCMISIRFSRQIVVQEAVKGK